MNVKERNNCLLRGDLTAKGLFPQLEELKEQPVQFEDEFGLKSIPLAPGLILIRGARQLGKSTWIENTLRKVILDEGPGSAIYLNGDEILNSKTLFDEILFYLPLLSQKIKVRKIFIDEITSIKNWELAIKRLYDSGETRDVLIITTGSKAIDLRRGTERLPGRKGRLERSNFLFTPISFKQFKEKCSDHFKENLLTAYLMTGGSPLAINELIRTEKIPEYVTELTRDWILGECAAQERSRNLLTWIIQSLLSRGGTPVPLVKLAKDAGAANNTVIRGYVDLLSDLMCISQVLPVDASTGAPLPRKSHKYHWIHLLAALSFHPSRPRTIQDFHNFSAEEQGRWLEWLVAQELWRRGAIQGVDQPEVQFYWQSDSHELDFKLTHSDWLEVKRGNFSPLEFAWFPSVFPKARLKVICNHETIENRFLKTVSIESFLCE